MDSHLKIPISERPKIVARVRDTTDTLEQIAADYDVTRERIRQIADEAGVRRRRVGEYWHGTITGYRYKCRCKPCRDARTTSQKAYRTQQTPEQRKTDNLKAKARMRKLRAKSLQPEDRKVS